MLYTRGWTMEGVALLSEFDCRVFFFFQTMCAILTLF